MALSLCEPGFKLLVGEVQCRELQRYFGCSHLESCSLVAEADVAHIGVVATSLRTHIGVILLSDGRCVVSQRSSGAAVDVVLLRTAGEVFQILKSLCGGHSHTQTHHLGQVGATRNEIDFHIHATVEVHKIGLGPVALSVGNPLGKCHFHFAAVEHEAFKFAHLGVGTGASPDALACN